MIQEAIHIIKEGDPSNWPKTKDNKKKVDRMGVVHANLTKEYVECSWCNRSAVYKHLKKWLEGHGHL